MGSEVCTITSLVGYPYWNENETTNDTHQNKSFEKKGNIEKYFNENERGSRVFHLPHINVFESLKIKHQQRSVSERGTSYSNIKAIN